MKYLAALFLLLSLPALADVDFKVGGGLSVPSGSQLSSEPLVTAQIQSGPAFIGAERTGSTTLMLQGLHPGTVKFTNGLIGATWQGFRIAAVYSVPNFKEADYGVHEAVESHLQQRHGRDRSFESASYELKPAWGVRAGYGFQIRRVEVSAAYTWLQIPEEMDAWNGEKPYWDHERDAATHYDWWLSRDHLDASNVQLTIKVVF